MDFSVPQERKQTRFVYVLPFSEQEALIEFTVFSLDFLSSREYEKNLKKYVDDYMEGVPYEISRKEYGIIPLTTYRFQSPGKRIVNIGMPGNMIKSSAGYTFLTMQAKLKRMVKRMEKGKPPSYRPSLLSHRFHMYDSTHLNVLQNGYAPGAKVFYRLFERNKGWRVLRFLDEETTVYQELFIFASVHVPSFLKGFLLYFKQMYKARSKVF
jgi:lycopene beta-cyclase